MAAKKRKKIGGRAAAARAEALRREMQVQSGRRLAGRDRAKAMTERVLRAMPDAHDPLAEAEAQAAANAAAKDLHHDAPWSEHYEGTRACMSMETDDTWLKFLEACSTRTLFMAISERAGFTAALADAALLCIKKSEDYNQTGQGDASDLNKADRDNYFPFGLKSHAHMLHIKAQRCVSLCLKDSAPNNEGFLDTCLDIINYAGFAVDWIRRKGSGDGSAT